jgi:hypothetical protein
MTPDKSRRLTPPESKADTSSGSAWSSFAQWIDERIDLKLRGERRFNRAVLAEVTARLIAQEKKPVKTSISKRRAQAR